VIDLLFILYYNCSTNTKANKTIFSKNIMYYYSINNCYKIYHILLLLLYMNELLKMDISGELYDVAIRRSYCSDGRDYIIIMY